MKPLGYLTTYWSYFVKRSFREHQALQNHFDHPPSIGDFYIERSGPFHFDAGRACLITLNNVKWKNFSLGSIKRSQHGLAEYYQLTAWTIDNVVIAALNCNRRKMIMPHMHSPDFTCSNNLSVTIFIGNDRSYHRR